MADYQQFVAGIYRDQSDYEQALFYQNKAYAVAKSLHDPQQMALVLWRRGITSHEQGNLSAALSDFQAAKAQNPFSLHLQGVLWLSLGHVQAHAATTATDSTNALEAFDQAEALLHNGEEDTYFIKFNVEGYHLNKASALLGAPVRKLRSPEKVFQSLSFVPVSLDRKRRSAYASYLQAKAWLEEGELPMARQIALDALQASGEIGSVVNGNRVATLYQQLRQTKFGKSPEVARLGLELQRVQNPSLFV